MRVNDLVVIPKSTSTFTAGTAIVTATDGDYLVRVRCVSSSTEYMNGSEYSTIMGGWMSKKDVRPARWYEKLAYWWKYA